VTGLQDKYSGIDLQTWRIDMDTSKAELFVDGCGFAMDSSRDGKYLLMPMMYGSKLGIFQLSVADKKCTTLIPMSPLFSQNSVLTTSGFSIRSLPAAK